MHPHKQIKEMEAEYSLGPFAATDQGPYCDTWSPAERLNKSTIVRIRSTNYFKNMSLLVKHLPLPSVEGSHLKKHASLFFPSEF